MNKRRFLSLIGLSGLATALAGCNTLSAFNTLTPKDGDSERLAQGISYGGGPRQTYDVYGPRKGAKNLPVIVFFYGGGWDSGSKDDYAWMGRSLAALGYIVAVPDYRLVPQVRYPDFLTDSAAAVRHVHTHIRDYGGDPEQLILMGHSAGAYNAMMLTLDPQYIPDIAVKAMIGLAGPYDFYPYDVNSTINAFGQWPRPQETQPIHHVRKLDTRFLLIHSRADTIARVRNSEVMAQKLSASGNAVTLKLYDGISHQDTAAAFSVPFRNKAPVRKDVADFLMAMG
ncbi:alpha/beta hydrolase [Asticcacaulis sp. ZE23SCel15]|uniref:alpha/beta hydrolase n=1 Tax=Asticcacaulis sp. ZE23SCel15 TaxID=3059027 RepID=UPI00265D659F|nr:alpha/beta hydrolase [Asticcacaulis sp. ZE23SCel15]WKL57902.1 alpha/beta hydrolase [Asticcacaulis sp. ZE23SCel15]